MHGHPKDNIRSTLCTHDPDGQPPDMHCHPVGYLLGTYHESDTCRSRKNCSDLDSLGGASELILSGLALPRAHCFKAGQRQIVDFQATHETGCLPQRREGGGEGLRLNGSQETIIGMLAAHHCDRKNENILFFYQYLL